MAPRINPSGRRITNGLVALGSAAVMTVYAAGYTRTREAAERLAEAERQRPPIPAPAESGPQRPAPEPPADLTRTQSIASSTALPEAARATPAPRPAETRTARAIESPVARNDAPAAATPVADTRTSEARAEPVTVPAPAPSATAASTTPAAEPPAAFVDPTAVANRKDSVAMPKVAYRDGAYSGYGTSRHGDIEAVVVISGGRIISAEISKCYTRWPCSWIKLLPPQVVQIQSAEVDFITGATVSTYAFYYAVIDALNKAK